ncbi:MAG: DNA primase small subunit domain-containing protein [Veillonellales bacterium]
MAKVEEITFDYCEVWHGKAKESWKRIQLDRIAEYQQTAANNFQVFATVQRFANAVKTKGENFISPLYFDLDDAENPQKSQKDAAKLIDFFLTELDCKSQDIQVFFSGSKGFHILIHEKALGIEPRNNLHKIMKHLASYLVFRLELTALDLVVYTAPRMMRLPNSIHEKTKLFKTQLTVNEIRTLSLDEIKTLASAPRTIAPTAEEDIMQRPKAANLYKNKMEEYLQAAITATTRYDKTEYHFMKGVYPACVQDLLDKGWKKSGDRNLATVQLACYFKDAGYSQEDALKTLESWVVKFTSADSGYQKQQRIANTRSVVSAIYSADNEYKFGCAYIRSLHGEKRPGQKDYDRVKCSGELCPCVADEAEETEIPTLHLAQTGNAEYNGKLVRTKVMIAGKKQTPYIIPKRIEYNCWGYKSCKKSTCPLYDLPTHVGYKNLGAKSRELIQMTGSNDETISSILRAMSEIPNCQRFNTDIMETVNVDELLVIPMAETDTKDDEKAGRYVLRRIYSLGELRINENKYYEITGYVYPHPKNQESTILLKSAAPLQDVVESFTLTEEIKKQLDVFRPSESAGYTPAAIDAKLSQICNDLTYNVTHIVERNETLLGVLLVQHSVLRLSVPWDTSPIRGWLELMVLGDTGTGKSALIEKTLRYAGLGTRINAEAAGRTGLTYKMEQSGPGGAWYIVWGAWPLADKELIWIDEAGSLPKELYGEMTMARSEGKLEVKRAVTAETPCRVRAILSSNVKSTGSIKRIADYGHGAEALKDLFNNEDIRRFDFAVCMKTTDVVPEKYNKILGTFPKSITSEAFKNNVLFAWSRTPEQVVFTPDTIDEILATATRLSKTYGKAGEIPLVSPSDQRNKVVRLSVALAALTHSVDESGEKIVVYPGHIQYIEAYLCECYNAPGCGLHFLAQLSVKEEELTGKGYKKLTNILRELPVLKEDGLYHEFVKLFARQKYLTVKDVEDMLNITKEQAKSITTLLARQSMVVKTTGGLRKTPQFNSFINWCFADGMFNEEE